MFASRTTLTDGMITSSTLHGYVFTCSNASSSLSVANITQLMAVYTQVVVGFLAKYGMGRHYEYILPNLPDLIHTFIIGEIGSFIAIGLVRTSICIFVLRLIQGTHPRTRTALYCVLSLNGLLTLAAVLSIGVQCQPLNKAWNPTIEGRCFSAHPFGTVIRVVGGMLPCTKRCIYWKTVET